MSPMTVSLPMCSVNFMDTTLSVEEQAVADRIAELKAELGEDLLILGHHYQRDSIVMHADFLGDSFMLSQKAADSKAKHIVFCGVHFMAESADILTSDEQNVILPNLRAGCSMADMATLTEVEVAWEEILKASGLSDPINRADPDQAVSEGEAYLVPVTYMNSSADLKDFVGRHGGVVCTSSNAEGVLNWAFERAGPKGAVLFFPDQHLGRNTGLAMGISADRMPTWTPGIGAMGELKGARIVLWHGFCSVHKRFTPQQIHDFRSEHPMVSWSFTPNVLVRPLTSPMPMAQRNTFAISSRTNLLARASPSVPKSTWWLVSPPSTRTSTSNAWTKKSVPVQPCT